jgi:hypothetical protein
VSISSTFICTNFSYERRFGSFFLVTHMYKNDVRVFYVDEIDTWVEIYKTS